MTLPGVASWTMASRICAGVRVGRDALTKAATPATCGAAIDVPVCASVSVSPPMDAEVMSVPGAKMSRHFPKLE